MEWVSWVVPFFNAAALLCAIYKKKEAFLIFMIPNVYWIGYTISHKTYPLTAVQIIYTVFNVWGYFRWRKEKKK
jgi:nicotinamide riboside transporter PnuC